MLLLPLESLSSVSLLSLLLPLSSVSLLLPLVLLPLLSLSLLLLSLSLLLLSWLRSLQLLLRKFICKNFDLVDESKVLDELKH